MDDRKTFLGPKVRRLRQQHKLTQAQMADDLGLSTSYLNLIENNQRPVTVQVILKLAQAYDIDLAQFAADDEAAAQTRVREIFTDPLFADLEISGQDIRDMGALSPQALDALDRLYDTLKAARESTNSDSKPLATTDQFTNEARDFLHSQLNHFPALETAAEQLWQEAGLKPGDLFTGLVRYIDERHGLNVRVLPYDVMGQTLRRYDYHGRRLLLNEMLPMPSRIFHLATQLAYFLHEELIDQQLELGRFTSAPSRNLARLALAHYFAGAVMMPYRQIHRAAETVRYDLNVLQARFQVSLEQVCHRLTTLQRNGERGVPFFMMRIDRAGNVSKRFAASGFHFSRSGGACPRWNVHDAFSAPGRVLTQVVEMPDRSRFFSLSMTVERPPIGSRFGGAHYALALGCDVGHARTLIYADGHDFEKVTPTPIGLNCRLCERLDCTVRAAAPQGKPVTVDAYRRETTPFSLS